MLHKFNFYANKNVLHWINFSFARQEEAVPDSPPPLLPSSSIPRIYSPPMVRIYSPPMVRIYSPPMVTKLQ